MVEARAMFLWDRIWVRFYFKLLNQFTWQHSEMTTFRKHWVSEGRAGKSGILIEALWLSLSPPGERQQSLNSMYFHHCTPCYSSMIPWSPFLSGFAGHPPDASPEQTATMLSGQHDHSDSVSVGLPLWLLSMVLDPCAMLDHVLSADDWSIAAAHPHMTPIKLLLCIVHMLFCKKLVAWNKLFQTNRRHGMQRETAFKSTSKA